MIADPQAAEPRRWPQALTIEPFSRAHGEVRLPGSKSISNRALLLAALASGTTELQRLLEADDTRVMIAALRALGVAIELNDENATIVGCNGNFPARDGELHLGNSGTSMRSLTAALAFAGGRYRLDGVPRMRERPIGELVDALNALGARIGYVRRPGYPPLQIEPAALAVCDSVEIKGDVSSQFVSGLLMAAPLVAPPTGLCVQVPGTLISQPYVALTLALMQRFGVEVERSGQQFVAPRAGYRSPGTYAIEGDASSASYFLALGAVAGGPVRTVGAGSASVQGDVAFANLLDRMGAKVQWGRDWVEVRAGSALRAVDADVSAIPDAAMTAAVVALFAQGRTVLRGIGSWRIKETDRIAAMATELGKLGADVDSGPDWLSIHAPAALGEATIDTYDDHRIAMCFSLVAAGGVPVHIRDPQCVEKTFPGYFDELARLTRSQAA